MSSIDYFNDGDRSVASIDGGCGGFFVRRGMLSQDGDWRFVIPGSIEWEAIHQDIYYAHRKKLIDTASPQVFDLRMVRNGQVAFWAQLRTIVASDADGTPPYRLVLSDIT